MECKSIKFILYIFTCLAIKVEPYWNVNKDALVDKAISETIKVEPYWNVNTFSKGVGLKIVNIKVEPYWNVNSDIAEVFTP